MHLHISRKAELSQSTRTQRREIQAVQCSRTTPSRLLYPVLTKNVQRSSNLEILVGMGSSARAAPMLLLVQGLDRCKSCHTDAKRVKAATISICLSQRGFIVCPGSGNSCRRAGRV
jgi:hypothetical protein